MTLTSDELNQLIAALENSETTLDGPMEEHGKHTPYIGWYWRWVDFDSRIVLGHCGAFIGFMENNKWDYDEWLTTPEQSSMIRQYVEAVALDPTTEHLVALYDYIQTCTPAIGALAPGPEAPEETA